VRCLVFLVSRTGGEPSKQTISCNIQCVRTVHCICITYKARIILRQIFTAKHGPRGQRRNSLQRARRTIPSVNSQIAPFREMHHSCPALGNMCNIFPASRVMYRTTQAPRSKHRTPPAHLRACTSGCSDFQVLFNFFYR
jgi:hypothetical protein